MELEDTFRLTHLFPTYGNQGLTIFSVAKTVMVGEIMFTGRVTHLQEYTQEPG